MGNQNMTKKFLHCICLYLIFPCAELVTWVTITPDINRLREVEGAYVQFTCQTSPGVPAPTVRWFKAENKSDIPPMEFTDGSQISIHPNISGTISSLKIIPRRNDSGIVIYCKAMINFTEVESQRRVSLDVMYPPGRPICTYRGREVTFVLRVIKGSDFDVCCTSDSYPSPKYEWHMFDGSKLSGACMTLFNIQTSNSGMYGIIATNVMNLTLGPSMTGFSSISIVVDVLYQPILPTLTVTNISLPETFRITSGTDVQVSCLSHGNPLPRYVWSRRSKDSIANTSVPIANTSVLTLTNVQHPTHTGLYVCTVMNDMPPTFDEFVQGSAVSHAFIDVLYGPEVQKMNDQTFQEGSRFQFDCPVTSGNPSDISVLWTRETSSAQWAAKTLTIPSVHFSDADFYTCTASNVLFPSFGESQVRIDAGSFRLMVVPVNDQKTSYTGAIVGGIISGITLVTIVTVLVCLLNKNGLLHKCIKKKNATVHCEIVK